MLKIIPLRESCSFEPGESAELELEWEQDQPIERLELRIVCNTVGKGDRNLEIAEIWSNQQTSPQGRERLTIPLPLAPYSFSGKLISVVWAFELICFPREESTRCEFILGPNAREVLGELAEN